MNRENCQPYFHSCNAKPPGNENNDNFKTVKSNEQRHLKMQWYQFTLCVADTRTFRYGIALSGKNIALAKQAT